MRGLQWFLVSAIICVSVKYSFAVEEYFGVCTDDNDCPDYATCQTVNAQKKCKCQAGYYAIDLPVYSNSKALTVCRDLGICSPFDNLDTDCGTNGQCVMYEDAYGVYSAHCKCKPGYTGIKCDIPVPVIPTPYTTGSPNLTTRRPGNIGSLLPIIGGGALLLLLLAGGGAALASTSG
uniref:Uncharacterized protein LOC111106429 n=1 Tax=Crassostrea virginica TaxID=6565 RepID=A0A8B8B073_CRAVI|nr:uncharacterized protein LOC111106429 [Crassostrea virginica]